MIALIGMNKTAGVEIFARSMKPFIGMTKKPAPTVTFQSMEQAGAAMGKRHGSNIGVLDLARPPKRLSRNPNFKAAYDASLQSSRNATALKGAAYGAASKVTSGIAGVASHPQFEHFDNAARGLFSGVRHMVGV